MTYVFCTVLHDDCGVFTLQNNSVYTSPARSGTGDILISAHINEDETEDFAIIDSTPYLSKIAYDIPNSVDGHYHSELLEFPIFSSANSYIAETRDVNSIITIYANLIYYGATGKFYKCKLTNPAVSIAPDAPTGATYWTQITDFTDSEVRKNTTISVGVFDDVATCRSKKCVKNALYNLSSKDVSCLDAQTLLPYLKKSIYLAGAMSLNSDQKPEQAEHVIRVLEKLCPC